MNALLSMFTIHDSKAEAYLQPFFSANIETARREFATAVNKEGQFNRWSEDYSLFYLGQFDQNEGTTTLETSPKHICNAITLKEVVPFGLGGRPPELKETTPR